MANESAAHIQDIIAQYGDADAALFHLGYATAAEAVAGARLPLMLRMAVESDDHAAAEQLLARGVILPDWGATTPMSAEMFARVAHLLSAEDIERTKVRAPSRAIFDLAFGASPGPPTWHPRLWRRWCTRWLIRTRPHYAEDALRHVTLAPSDAWPGDALECRFWGIENDLELLDAVATGSISGANLAPALRGVLAGAADAPVDAIVLWCIAHCVDIPGCEDEIPGVAQTYTAAVSGNVRVWRRGPWRSLDLEHLVRSGAVDVAVHHLARRGICIPSASEVLHMSMLLPTRLRVVLMNAVAGRSHAWWPIVTGAELLREVRFYLDKALPRMNRPFALVNIGECGTEQMRQILHAFVRAPFCVVALRCFRNACNPHVRSFAGRIYNDIAADAAVTATATRAALRTLALARGAAPALARMSDTLFDYLLDAVRHAHLFRLR